MNKLKVVIASEKAVTSNMAGCGRNNPSLCGTKECSFNGTSRED